MKPLFKLPFGLGVYKRDDVDGVKKKYKKWHDMNVKSWRKTNETQANLLMYLRTLKGNRRRASADKIERILSEDK